MSSPSERCSLSPGNPTRNGTPHAGACSPPTSMACEHVDGIHGQATQASQAHQMRVHDTACRPDTTSGVAGREERHDSAFGGDADHYQPPCHAACRYHMCEAVDIAVPGGGLHD